jgi:hypothetical protein
MVPSMSEIVCRLVEEQEVGLGEQHGRERDAHAPAARKIGTGARLRGGVEAEPVQDRGGAGGGRVRLDIDEAGLDLGPPHAVRVFGLGHQRRAFAVGREHDLDERFGAARSLLRDRPDADPAGQGDSAALARDLALNESEQRRLAGPVASDQADAGSRRQCRGGAIEDEPVADPVGELVDVKHGALVVSLRPRGKMGRKLDGLGRRRYERTQGRAKGRGRDEHNRNG